MHEYRSRKQHAVRARTRGVTRQRVQTSRGTLSSATQLKLQGSVDVLDLSVRARNCLLSNRIKSLGQLVKCTDVELLRLANLGNGTLYEIKLELARHGLRLGMNGQQAEIANLEVQSPPSPPMAPEIAVLQWLREFSPRQHEVIRARICESTLTLEELGQQLGVTRERIRQIESKLEKKLGGFARGPFGEPVRLLAERFRRDLGAAFPRSIWQAYSAASCTALDAIADRELVARFALWVAGPYEQSDTWLTSDCSLGAKTKNSLKRRTDLRGSIPLEAARAALSELDLRETHHEQWLCDHRYFEMDGDWFPRLSNIPDRVEQILRYRGEPVTAEVLAPLVDCESERSLRARLLEDRRFKRISRQAHFALRTWEQYDEYSGIAEEIAEEIARQGGAAKPAHLIDAVSSRYKVKRASVKAYLSAPMFSRTAEGLVRLRGKHERQNVQADPRVCSGLYSVDNKWILRVEVTADTLRGSGRPLPAAVAVLLGCQPGERKVFRSPADEIVVSWPPSSASGPNLGSLKPDTDALGGKLGDFLFLTLEKGAIGVRLLPASCLAHRNPTCKLALLLGLPESDAIDAVHLEAIARAIGIGEQLQEPSADVVHAHLMRRNEIDLARLLKNSEARDEEDILAKLATTIGL
jgi:hypothetical protein